MSTAIQVTLAEALGLGGRGMMSLRKRGNVWWAYWRDPNGRQRYRSTGQLDHAKAMRAGALMIVADTEALAPAEEKPRTDATIEEILGWYPEFRCSPSRNREDTRPLESTAKDYISKTRRLAKLSKSVTVGDLRAQASQITAKTLGVGEGAFTSLLRGAGAGLFGENYLSWLKENKRVELSNPLLGNVPPVSPGSLFYGWTPAQLQALKDKARNELKVGRTPEYLIFMLAIGAGNRRSEATFRKWSDISDLGVTITWTSARHTKTLESRRTVPMAHGFVEELKSFRGDGEADDYVVPDGEVYHRAEPVTGSPDKRAERACRRLSRWLRENGIASRNPIHHLRRLCGSAWEQQFGLKQASVWLGHTDVVVTARHYVGQRPEAVAGW